MMKASNSMDSMDSLSTVICSSEEEEEEEAVKEEYDVSHAEERQSEEQHFEPLFVEDPSCLLFEIGDLNDEDDDDLVPTTKCNHGDNTMAAVEREVEIIEEEPHHHRHQEVLLLHHHPPYNTRRFSDSRLSSADELLGHVQKFLTKSSEEKDSKPITRSSATIRNEPILLADYHSDDDNDEDDYDYGINMNKNMNKRNHHHSHVRRSSFPLLPIPAVKAKEVVQNNWEDFLSNTPTAPPRLSVVPPPAFKWGYKNAGGF